MRSCQVLSVDSEPAVRAALHEHPGARVLGGGTVLLHQIERSGWAGVLLDLSRCGSTRHLGPGRIGASVRLSDLADLAGGDGTVPAHLAAAARSSPPDVRRQATVGGNCAPDVAGCVYLALLSLNAQARIVPGCPGGAERLPLRGWHPESGAGQALLDISWDAAELAGGGFARTRADAGTGLPGCAVAVAVIGPAGTLRIVVGYLTRRPVVVTVAGAERSATYSLVWRAVRRHRPTTARAELDECLRHALRGLG